MDGVLSDFEARYVELFGERPSDIQRRNKEFYAYWETFVKGKNFEVLPPHKGGVELLEYLGTEFKDIPVEILSSSGGQHFHEEVAEQKRKWLCDHGITYNPIIVPGGSKKAEYAKSLWDILIDDTERNIDKFRKAGGTGILHTNVDDTIKQLRRIHLQWIGDDVS